jgi:NADH:ubiquinone oxidoreductase subunit 4 (subunit M)
MLLILLLLTPLIGIFLVSTIVTSEEMNIGGGHRIIESSLSKLKQIKIIALSTSIINLFISLVVFMLFNFSNNNFQFVQEYHRISSFDFYLGVDGLSIYFVLLTTIIMPIALLSN